jgi:hypothetical protein
MVTRTAPMSPVLHSRTTDRSHLFQKLVLLFLLVIASAFGLLILFRARPGYPEWLQNWFAVTVLAIMAGFGARWVLNRRSGFIRFIAAMSTYIAGLYLLGLVSEWKYGIGPLEFWPHQTDVEGLVQIGIGLIIYLLVFLAWRRRSQVSTLPAEPHPVPAPPPSVEAKPARRPRSSLAGSVKRRPALDFLKPRAKPIKVTRTGRKRLKKAVRPITEADLPARPKRRNLFRGRTKVQLAIVEEHRCPFCLEPVSRVDPRGVVECDVCHTLHHKDCWEVTGVCQVPHMNS